MSAKKQENQSIFSHLSTDIPSSIIVALVAIPLCLGIALASGAPLFSGILAGIVGGIIVGSVSGSSLGVSGPAAGLAVIVLMSIQELGAFEIFLVAVIIAGLFQLIFGFLKAGIVAYYFPSNVVKGMLAGIGVVLLLKQIPHAAGYDKVEEGSLVFQQSDHYNTFSELFHIFSLVNPAAIIISLISLAILILWEQPFMKSQLTKVLSGPLVVVMVGVLLGAILTQVTGYALTAEQFVQIPIPENIGEISKLITFPDFTAINNPVVWKTGFVIALVASIETLLCAEATDKLDPQKRITPMNRELQASGVGNIISGLIGGLPVTQVIVRSSANIQSGAKTKMSAILHGFIILISALTIPAILNMIPLSSLAAILLMVAYKLAKPELFKKMYQQGWSQFLPFVATVIGIALTDLLTGISLGMAISIFFILYNNHQRPYFFDIEKYEVGQPIVLQLAEEVTFINKVSVLQTLKDIPADSKLVIDFSKTINIDPDVLEIIEDFKENAKYKNIEVVTMDKKAEEVEANYSTGGFADLIKKKNALKVL
jgi:MFS superfamily sulfate permease-like transporter